MGFGSGSARKVLFCVINLCLLLWAEEPRIAFTPHGGTSLEVGQIVKGISGTSLSDTMHHQWIEKTLMQLGFTTVVNERLRILLSGECMMTYSKIRLSGSTYETTYPTFSFYVNQGEGIYSIGDLERPILEVGVGYFPFSYNPDIRNLGLYLFRTGTYPGYMINEFDTPFSRLCGLHLKSTYIRALSFDLLLTTETDFYPAGDGTLSGLIGYKLGKILDIGAGISFSHLFSINEEYTTPKTWGNFYFTAGDSVDTMHYTFRGTKVMGRLSIDPKGFFPSVGIFGKEDLKIYGEGCILGLEDQGPLYDTLSQRLPIMFGFNIPAFKLLDVLSLEIENYPSPLANSNEYVFTAWVPQPYPAPDSAYRKDDWKWSVYARKTIANGVFCVFQVARDHMRPVTHDIKSSDRADVLIAADDWYWILKCGFSF